MFKQLSTAALLVGLAVPAFAGGPVPVPVEPEPLPPMPVARADWTGGYVGATLGYGRLTAPGAANSSGATGGLHAGYNADYGNWVLGGEVTAAPGMNRTIAGQEVRYGLQARLKAGPKLGADGRTWAFGSVGVNHVGHQPVGGGASASTTGYVVGLGLSHLVNDNWFLTGELQHSKGGNVKGTGAVFSASYRF